MKPVDFLQHPSPRPPPPPPPNLIDEQVQIVYNRPPLWLPRHHVYNYNYAYEPSLAPSPAPLLLEPPPIPEQTPDQLNPWNPYIHGRYYYNANYSNPSSDREMAARCWTAAIRNNSQVRYGEYEPVIHSLPRNEPDMDLSGNVINPEWNFHTMRPSPTNDPHRSRRFTAAEPENLTNASANSSSHLVIDISSDDDDADGLPCINMRSEAVAVPRNVIVDCNPSQCDLISCLNRQSEVEIDESSRFHDNTQNNDPRYLSKTPRRYSLPTMIPSQDSRVSRTILDDASTSSSSYISNSFGRGNQQRSLSIYSERHERHTDNDNVNDQPMNLSNRLKRAGDTVRDLPVLLLVTILLVAFFYYIFLFCFLILGFGVRKGFFIKFSSEYGRG